MSDVEAIYALSPVQEGMLFHGLLQPRSGVYVEQVLMRLRGKLDVVAFERAWRDAVARHPALRTTFHWEEVEQPLQVVYAAVDLSIEHDDWSADSAVVQDERFTALLAEDRRRGFEFAEPPLLRLRLVRVAAEEQRLLFTFHHILLDGWCMPLLFNEVLQIYEALAAGRSPVLERVRPYRAYIDWLEARDPQPVADYWRAALAGFTAPTPLTALSAPSSTAASRFDEVSHLFTVEQTNAMQAFGKQSRVTMSTLVQGAWALLLGRYSGEKDVVFGMTVAGRPPELDGVDKIIGLFINTLPVRVRLTDESIVSWLKQLGDQAQAHRAHEHSALTEIQRVSEVPRGQPLFETIVVFENYPIGKALEAERRAIEITDVHAIEQTNYPLSLFAIPGERLELRLSYDCGRFDVATAKKMLAHLARVLAQLSTERRLDDVTLLGDDEEREVTRAWNESRSETPDATVDALFEAQAARTPSVAAVAVGDAELSYAELDARSNQLARYLKKLGVGPDVLVGLYMERSVEMVVGLLGIMKAGGAYVPLDPEYPADRVEYMLRDSKAAVLVTQASLDGKLTGAKAVRLDADWPQIAKESAAALAKQTKAENLAYVIYTSGSTGKPKGVQIGQGALVSFLWSMKEALALGEKDVWAAVTSLSFDIAGLELYLPLLVGAKLVVVSRSEAQDGPALKKRLAASGATMLQATPATWTMLMEAGGVAELELQALCGGEALPRKLGKQLAEQTRVAWNVYGPTETTIWSSKQRLQVDDETVTVGRALANQQLYVLDAQLRAVPVGVAGELYIGGRGLGRGYLERPELTAEKFVANPYGTPGSRMYRTGDLARWRSDGVVEVLGRLDHQVKVRGFRIELGEIEAALGAQATVREVVVVAREDQPGQKRLVAYLTAKDAAHPPTAEHLRSALKTTLPEYMVPAAFVVLEKLPQTPNGKVDRKALPAADLQVDAATYIAPRNEREAQLAQIWQDVLGIAQIGIDDDFFALGGHSLLALRSVSKMREALAIDLPVLALFDSPTVRRLAERLEIASTPAVSVIPRAADAERRQLSYAQQRLWFLDQLQPGSAFYNLPSAFRATGVVDIGLFEESLQALAARHESLRTRFATDGGTPIQVIEPTVGLTMRVLDLRARNTAQREAELTQALRKEAAAPFDLARAPLFRATLVRLADDDTVVMFVSHHAVSDGWSFEVLVEDLAEIYSAKRAGRAPRLDPLPAHYADYAAWQRSWLSGDVLDAQLVYWRAQLEGAPALLQLPTDRPRPAVQTHRGAMLRFSIPTDTSRELARLAGEEGATLFMVLLACYEVLLARYSGQKDIVIGTPVANRGRAETERLIGFFANTLVIRNDLSARPTFRELVQKVRETTLGALAHQDAPFEKLVEVLQPTRSLGHSPLFQTWFVLARRSLAKVGFADVVLEPLELETGTAQFDLSLAMEEGDDGVLAARFEYNTDLFDESSIARMAASFQCLLEDAVARPQAAVDELAVISPADQQKIIGAWNDTHGDYPSDRGVDELFEAQVDRTPERVAVVFEGQALTYRELDERANLIAHRLRALGVGPDALVGIYVSRSADMVAGLLGIMKAGGAYVPLDPDYPADRIEYMVRDANAAVILTESSLASRLPQTPAHVLCMDEITGADRARPTKTAASHHLAYTIYTSGSTGRPKGVQISRRALVNLLWSMKAAPGLDETDVWVAVTSLSFDIAGLELYLPLLVGAKLVVVSRADAHDGAALRSRLGEHGATTMQATPSTWTMLLEESIAPLRLKALCGGEALSRKLAQQLFASTRETWNVYGPTETTIWSSMYRLRETDEVVPIGRPLANQRLYVLDEKLRPVPVGVKGELYIGGDGLARGYLARPELTAEKFVADPFQRDAKMYRTGDEARYLPDGNVECLGRVDNQVKLRGFRIELGEIETQLGTIMNVRDAVVTVREDRAGDKRLVAYLVAKPATELPPIEALRSALKSKLPDYMVPSAFVVLAELPKTPNGKVDRRALPAPEAASGSDYHPPHTETERLLTHAWSEVLGVPRVGMTDNFFDLGGHSFLAMRLVSRLREVFQIQLAPQAIFEAQTPAEQIALISHGAHLAPPLVHVDRARPLPLSLYQQRFWRYFVDGVSKTSPNVSSAAFIRGRLDLDAVKRSIAEILRRHEVLRSAFEEGPNREPILRIEAPAAPNITFIDLRALPKEERNAEAKRQFAKAKREPFVLTSGPLIRFLLLRVDEEEHVLASVAHHIITDAVSQSLLTSEFVRIYEAFSQQRPSPLPELKLQYVDFADWQRRYLSGESLQEQIDYWTKHLRGGPRRLTLPIDREEVAGTSRPGLYRAVELSDTLLEAVRELGRRESCTLFMTLFAAFDATLYAIGAGSSITVGVPIAVRNPRETEQLIGYFLNHIALHVELRPEMSFRELLMQVRAVALGGFAHQTLPLADYTHIEHLIEKLYQVRFNFFHTSDEIPMTRTGISYTPLEIEESESTPFELAMYVEDSDKKTTVRIRYRTDLFETATIDRIIETFVRVLSTAVGDATAPLPAMLT